MFSIILNSKEKPNPNFIPPATKKVKEKKMVLLNIPMPPRCLECPCIVFNTNHTAYPGVFCNADVYAYMNFPLDEKTYLYTRPDWCPMEEVKND